VYPNPFFLAIEAEPEDKVGSAPGMDAADYAAMYRHVVQLLRAEGADQLVTVAAFIGNQRWLRQPWFGDLYPGSDVVDWVAFDPFVVSAAAQANSDDPLGALVGDPGAAGGEPQGFLGWAAGQAPDKPVMLSEWGVFGSVGKAAVFRSLADLPKRYPQVKALCYWESEEPFQRAGEAPLPPTTIASSGSSLAAYRRVGRLPYYSVRPPVVTSLPSSASAQP
jgi:hypothetical protein